MNDRQQPPAGLWRHTPNGLTLLRLAIALCFPFSPENYHLLLIIIGLASEFLDGFIARLNHWTSYLGQVLDPIADKLLVLSVSLTWVWLGKLAVTDWLLLATRDFGVLLIFLLLLLLGRIGKVRSVKARYPSKITTALQYAAFLMILAEIQGYLTPLVWVTAAVGAVAAMQYAWLLRKDLIPGQGEPGDSDSNTGGDS